MQRYSKIILLFSAVFVFLAESATAQIKAPGTLTWGNEYNEPNNTMASKIIGLTPDGFYVLRHKMVSNPNARPKAWVEYFDRDMKLKKSEELELKYKGKRRDLEDVIFLGGELYLMTSFNNTAKKRNYLFKQKINIRSLVASKKLDMIADTEARNKEVEGSFGFQISKDSTKLLVYNDLPYENKQPERFGFHVFDQNFEPVWEKNIILPYPDNQFTVEEYRVDEQGNVYLLGVLYEDEAKLRRRGSPTYKYVILAYSENGETAEEYRIDLPGKFITDLTFRIANDGMLTCSGFYSDKGTYSIKGTYFFRLDTVTKEFYNRNYKAFDFDFLTESMSEKNKAKAKNAERNNDRRRAAELYDYSLDELILRSDGGAVLVAEQFYVERETYNDYASSYYPYYGYYNPYYYSRNNYQTDYYYNYNDIIVVNIRPTGEIEWAARIPKRQETRNDGGYYLSYAMAIVRDKLFFLFNDNARNYSTKRKENRFYNYNGSESVIVLAEINKNGEVQASPLASNREAGVITRPKMCKQIGRREMAVFGERGRRYRFGSLIFE
jgi:hypothetical protein